MTIQRIVLQRPGTAKGFFVLTLEDETSMVNAVVTPDMFQVDAMMARFACARAITASTRHPTAAGPPRTPAA